MGGKTLEYQAEKQVLFAEGKQRCSKCEVVRPLEEYRKSKANNYGCHPSCKVCDKTYREVNRAKIKEAKRLHKQKNKEYYLEYNRQDRKRNKTRYQEYHKQYQLDNKEKLQSRVQERRDNDIQIRLAHNLSGQVLKAVKRFDVSKTYPTQKLLGCTLPFFMEFISSQFMEGMTWDNYGYETWHLDHKRPVASFDLMDETQQKECFHYSNYQPLSAFDNVSKGSTWNGERYRYPDKEVV